MAYEERPVTFRRDTLLDTLREQHVLFMSALAGMAWEELEDAWTRQIAVVFMTVCNEPMSLQEAESLFNTPIPQEELARVLRS